MGLNEILRVNILKCLNQKGSIGNWFSKQIFLPKESWDQTQSWHMSVPALDFRCFRTFHHHTRLQVPHKTHLDPLQGVMGGWEWGAVLLSKTFTEAVVSVMCLIYSTVLDNSFSIQVSRTPLVSHQRITGTRSGLQKEKGSLHWCFPCFSWVFHPQSFHTACRLLHIQAPL